MTNKSNPSQKIRHIALVGSQGYSGQQLQQLLMQHPYVERVSCYLRQTSSSTTTSITTTPPTTTTTAITTSPTTSITTANTQTTASTHTTNAPNTNTINTTKTTLTYHPLEQLVDHTDQIDVLCLATPVSGSLALLSQDLSAIPCIIDLSGALRLPESIFNAWYPEKHTRPELIEHAHYGLCPWSAYIQTFSPQTLIANPGCYATCALMALIPLLKHHCIKHTGIIIDAKSGVTGAGKSANNPTLLFAELSHNFFPYKIGCHQHTPEIEYYCQAFTQQKPEILFQAHLLPVPRGIAMTIYADLSPDLCLQFSEAPINESPTAQTSVAQAQLTHTPLKPNALNGNTLNQTNHNTHSKIIQAIQNAYTHAYANYPLVNVVPLTQQNVEEHYAITALKNIQGKPHINLAYRIQHGKLIIYACIDNLMKGAASQAIENINAWAGLPLTTGLLTPEQSMLKTTNAMQATQDTTQAMQATHTIYPHTYKHI